MEFLIVGVFWHHSTAKKKKGRGGAGPDDNVPEPMVGGGNARHGDPQVQRRDFGAVQEVGAEEADGDEEVEHEDEEHARDLGRQIRRRERGCDGQAHHAHRHPNNREG